MHKIKVQQFEGPLDLLLQLIEDQKLEITEVSLAQVTEQYIQILNQASEQQIKPQELADFLVVASRLLLIKSRALLPFLQWEQEEEEELTVQLKIYKEYLDASNAVKKIIGKKRFSFSREKLLTVEVVDFAPPAGLVKNRLGEIFKEIINKFELVISLPQNIIKRTINIQERIQQLRERIMKTAKLNFSDILKESKDRTEVIVNFLALLELMKQRIVVVRQDRVFEDITIEKVDSAS